MSNFVALIVEDDVFQRECLADLLKGEGLEVVECANARRPFSSEALSAAAATRRRPEVKLRVGGAWQCDPTNV
jgi:CheY-like chemotaxis protein